MGKEEGTEETRLPQTPSNSDVRVPNCVTGKDVRMEGSAESRVAHVLRNSMCCRARGRKASEFGTSKASLICRLTKVGTALIIHLETQVKDGRHDDHTISCCVVFLNLMATVSLSVYTSWTSNRMVFHEIFI